MKQTETCQDSIFIEKTNHPTWSFQIRHNGQNKLFWLECYSADGKVIDRRVLKHKADLITDAHQLSIVSKSNISLVPFIPTLGRYKRENNEEE